MKDTGNYKGEKEEQLLRKQKKSVKEKYLKSIIQTTCEHFGVLDLRSINISVINDNIV